MSRADERYGDLFKVVRAIKDKWRDISSGAVDKPTKRYGNLFRRFDKSQTQNYNELSAQMKRSTDSPISIEDCIAYLDAAKAKINELEAVGTYQATQESKSIKSDFAELVEKMLKDKYFAIGKVDGKFTAFVFGSTAKRGIVITSNPQSNLVNADYDEFLQQSKIGCKNISNYYTCDGAVLIFQI